jgi:DNA-binding transcriptional LysR family regulator
VADGGWHIARATAERATVRAHFELEVRSHQAYYLVCPQDKQHIPAVVAFRDWLLVEAERARSRTTETAGA